jgi:hypothetical protein
MTFARSISMLRVIQDPDESLSGEMEMEGQLSTARLVFHGIRHGNEGRGELEIFPSTRFVERGREMLEGTLTVGELLRFGMQKEPLEYIELVSAGGSRWTWGEVLNLQQRGVSPKFIAAMRKAPARPENAAPRDARREKTREPFGADDLVLLHSRGVSADYVEALDACGTSFEANEIVLLHSRGVSVDYLRAAAGAGLQADPSQLVVLWSRGVPAGFIREIQKMGYNFDPQDLVLLHSRGVPTAFARELKSAGYDYSSHDLVLVHSRGVPASYAVEVANADYQPLAAGDLVRLHAAGVPTETVKRLRK